MAADRSAEIGLHALDRQALRSGTGYFEEHVRQEVVANKEKATTKQKLEVLENPTTRITEAQAKKILGDYLREDSENTAGALEHSTSQIARKNEAETQITRIIALRDKGWAGLTPTDQDQLKNQLADYLKTNETFLAVARAKGINILSPTALTTEAQGQAAILLANSPEYAAKLAEKFLTKLIDQPKADYDGLHNMFDRRKNLTKQIGNLATEIGTPAVGGRAATGLEKNIAETQAKLDEFGYDHTAAAGVVTATARAKTNERNLFEAKVQALKAEAGRFTAAANKVTNTSEWRKLPAVAGSTTAKIVDDPASPGSALDIEDVDRSTRATQWSEDAQKKLSEVEGYQRKVQEYDDLEKELKRKVEEFKQQKKFKEDEKKRLEDELGIKAVAGAAATGLEKAIEDKKQEIAGIETKYVDGLKGGSQSEDFLPDALTDVWYESANKTKEVAAERKDRVMKAVKKMVSDMVTENYYDRNKRQFDTKKLVEFKKRLMLPNGYQREGNSMFNAACGRLNAVPDALNIVTREHSDTSVAEQDYAWACTEVLKLLAYKKPKELKKQFTDDEALMLRMRGDMLPVMFENAMKDESFRKIIESDGNSELLKNRGVKEWWKNLDKKKWTGIITLILGGTVLAMMLAGSGGITASGLMAGASQTAAHGGQLLSAFMR